MNRELPLGRVLVTGGAGFIGSQLLKRILPLAESITVIDDCSTGSRSNVPVSDKLTFIEASYVDEELLDRVLPDVEYIFHVACSNLVLSAQRMDQDFHVNLYGGYLLLRKAKEKCARLRRLVYTSTASVYGNATVYPTPESEYQTTLPYSASKFSVEHYCQVFHKAYGMPVTVLRLSNVYGPGQLTSNPYCGVIAKFFEAAELGEPFVIYGSGLQTRDFTYVEDVMDAILAASTHSDTIGGVYNVGTGVETTVLQLAEKIRGIAGNGNPLQHQPSRPVDLVRRRCLDASLLRRTIGWSPRASLDEGLELTHLWRKGGGRLADPARND